MDAYALHLAMAALVGASVVAFSAYFMHRKTLEQVLEYARAERETSYYRRGSASLPDVTAATLAGGDDDHQVDRHRPVMNGSFTASNAATHGADDPRSLPFPPGLPRLHILPEGNRHSVSANSNKRTGHVIRTASPRSPVPCAFESLEGSADDDSPSDTKLEDAYMDPDRDDVPKGDSFFQTLPGEVETEANSKTLAAANIIRSHSVSGDLHGAQADPVAADILRKEPEHERFIKLRITPTETPSVDEAEVYKVLQECLKLREGYVFREEVAPWEKEIITDPSTPKPNPNPFAYVAEEKTDHHFQMEDGVVHVYANKDSTERLFPVADATTFFTDLHRILKVIAAGNIRTVCHRRLVLLEQKFNLHLMLNADAEFLAQKSAPHRDFYNVRKVDTHVHHSACMNQKHLLRFIKSKLRKEPDEVVIFRDGTYLTLKEVFESLDLTGYDLNVDLLDVHADKSTFHRFDKFNLKYNPCGQSRLREIFLKQENLIQGRFLAEVTKEVFSDLAASKYQMAEYRISIYGRKQSEWDQLASWIVNNDLYSGNVVWLIQLPRLYNVYKELGIVTSFQNILDNIFLPLFEVTVNPDSHPQLHVFLKQVVGLDLVDDESKPERRPTKHMPTPAQWTNIFNPAFSYYAYYCYANLYTLNKLRESKGMTTIKFRPHSGEAGDIDHLAATFLTAHNIAHGINLRKSPVLQYLYYLAQIGLAMSPLSNNSLFLDYHRNPFPVFFMRGLNVSLSTDDPLQIHLTKEPLVEEYSIAASVWKLSSSDICEIARNSVYQSGFSHALKSHWIGKMYYKRGPDGNDIHKTNVPHIRIEFRDMIWREEMQLVFLGKPDLPEETDP
ncbi:unnamed protein product [Spirodela intermedia]|uniref:AMP deaminase n=1 Tax=Spirodela intermedia TaxID=51605 RepID=A0A7I8IBM0_SPIIN|nr:unnamed protein product [Spirodela intermedia]CAA6654744.1 unnamed protein product [Spirodela intermedia]